MKIFGLTVSALAGRAIPARQSLRAKILRAIHGDQRMAAKAGQRRQGARRLHRRQRLVEQSMQAGRLDAIEHIADMIVAGNVVHSQQRLAIRAAWPIPWQSWR